MPVASRSSRIAGTWRALSPEQRAAGIGALLLIASTFGPFSFVEAAIVLVALAILLLIAMRAEGREFHLPFGDGTVIALAGLWCAFLILIRLFDRPLGQNLLALACAAILLAAGVHERARRPADDLASERARRTRRTEPLGDDVGTRPLPDDPRTEPFEDVATRPLADDPRTRPLPDDSPKMRPARGDRPAAGRRR